jgi:hypothetical protein
MQGCGRRSKSYDYDRLETNQGTWELGRYTLPIRTVRPEHKRFAVCLIQLANGTITGVLEICPPPNRTRIYEYCIHSRTRKHAEGNLLGVIPNAAAPKSRKALNLIVMYYYLLYYLVVRMGKHHELGESYANSPKTFSAYQHGRRKTQRKATSSNQSIGFIK